MNTKNQELNLKPILKWVGGKRQLLNVINNLHPKKFDTYCEPFFWWRGCFIFKSAKKAIINDINSDLITVYEVIRDDVEALIENLRLHKNTSEYFYKIR